MGREFVPIQSTRRQVTLNTMISLNFVKWKLLLILFWLRHGRSRRFPFGCIVINPIKFSSKHIRLGRRVVIANAGRLEAVTRYNKTIYTPMILIGENVTIEQNLHLTCANRIVIGNNTAIAANVTITDIEHPYTDVNIPIERHDLVVKEVVIGEDSKIYNNAVILPGVHIGKHCVIGANSVVARDIPDFSVAVGAPSRVVKQYDRVLETWVVLGGNTSERSLHTE
jgi:acetyltransferase-like isoleucine patch superfamily enzyme